MSGHLQTTLIVPCYNEEKRLDVAQFRQFLAHSSSTRLLFVNDGSTDKTMELLTRLAAPFRECAQVLQCERNGGKAEAVRRGLIYALDNLQQDFIGYWDADLATPLSAVTPLRDVLRTHPEVEMVFGARVKLLGRSIHRRQVRHYLGRIFATVVSQMLQLAIYDTQCGAKIFRASPQLSEVVRQPFLSKWVFDVEIIARYLKLYNNDPHRLEEVIYEYPLQEWKDIGGSKVRPKDFVTAFVDVARIWYRYLA